MDIKEPLRFLLFFQYQPDIKQEAQNGGGIIPEEDSCVMSDLASEGKDEDAIVSLYKREIN